MILWENLIADVFAATHDKPFFPNNKGQYTRYTYCNCDEMIKAVHLLLDNIYVCFGYKICRQVVAFSK